MPKVTSHCCDSLGCGSRVAYICGFIYSSVCRVFTSSGVFKYPQHMARETRGEMEPSDLKLLTGELNTVFSEINSHRLSSNRFSVSAS